MDDLDPFAPAKRLDFTDFMEDRIEVDRRDSDGTVWIAFTQKYGGCVKRHVIALDSEECWRLVRALMSHQSTDPES